MRTDPVRAGHDMVIELNGAVAEVVDGITVTALMDAIGAPSRGSAAVVDGEVLPRSSWPEYALRAGQVVEVITAKQGG